MARSSPRPGEARSSRASLRSIAVCLWLSCWLVFWLGMLSLSRNSEGEDNVFPCPDPQSIDWVPANDVPYTLLA
eukprot:COSAG02_NODE_129_length_34796_cov_26.576015_12_plen_74_part_00